MELFKASNQWSTRPADERFWDLKEMSNACFAYKNSACESTVENSDLRVEARDGEVLLSGRSGVNARLSHWAFGQFSRSVNAPPSYLRTLPATLAAQNLNHGLADLDGKATQKLMFHQNGNLVLRSVTSENYGRVWNADVIDRLMNYLPAGWQVPPARPCGKPGERTRKATEKDCLYSKKQGLSINPGDLIAPAGLYASDHDMFMFLVNENHGVDDGTGHELNRGFFLWNSEVGDKSFGLMTFLYDAICGNHIVWGAKGVMELRIRHTKHAEGRAFQSLSMDLRRYSDSSASDMQAKIQAARKFEFGKTKEEAVENLLTQLFKRKVGIPQKTLELAYDRAEASPRYGAPTTAWGFANGLTELSQELTHTDARVNMDRAAGKVLEIAF